jgi:PAS domain S-box-containing protein
VWTAGDALTWLVFAAAGALAGAAAAWAANRSPRQAAAQAGAWRERCKELELELQRARLDLNTPQRNPEHVWAVIEHAHDAIFVKDTEGRYVLINPAGARYMDRPAMAILGRHDHDFFSPEDARHIDETDAQVLRTRQPCTYETRRRIGNRDLVFSTTKFPYLSRQGKVLGVIGISREVTDRRRAEEGLRRTQRLLDAVHRAQGHFIATLDPRPTFDGLLGELLRLTDSAYGFIGEVLTAADGQPYLKTFSITNIAWDDETRAFYAKYAPEGMEFHNLRTLFGAVLRSGQPLIANDPPNHPEHGGTPPGHPPLAAFLGVPLHHQGRLIGMVGLANRPGGYDEELIAYLGPFLTTCTHLILAHQQLEQRYHAEEALRRSEQRFRLLVETARDAICTIARDGTFVSLNPAFAAITGHDYAAWVGRLIVQLVHPDDVPLVERMTDRLFRGQTPPAFELRVLRRDGTTAVVECLSTPLVQEHGVTGALVIARDLGERKNLEEQIRQAQKMEAVGRLAGGVAHDFNNLLTVITGFTELMRGSYAPGDPFRDFLDEIRKATDQATGLTRQLLAFSRKQMLAPVVLNLNAIVAHIDRMLRRLIGADIEMNTDLAPDLWPVKADPGQVEQMILNLAVNARDAMPGGGRLTVATANVTLEPAAGTAPGAPPGDYVRLTIADTGVGMDAATQARIFEPFFTTKEVGRGTGLGLAMVYGIVNQSGGYIDVASTVGRGTTFTVYLPRLEEDQPADPAPPVLAAPATGTETILLVEDEEGVRTLAHNILQNLGYTVLECRDGEEGLAVCRDHNGPIDLVLSDVVMPRCNGLELMEQVRRQRPGIRYLFMSGYANEELIRRGGVNGDDGGFLQKPFTPADLAREVRAVLDR